jgi:hypothetical protein
VEELPTLQVFTDEKDIGLIFEDFVELDDVFVVHDTHDGELLDEGWLVHCHVGKFLLIERLHCIYFSSIFVC